MPALNMNSELSNNFTNFAHLNLMGLFNRKLYLFMIRSFFWPLIMTLFIAIFVLLMQWLWKYVDDLVGKGLPMTIIAQLLFWASSTMIPLALPLAILLSSIMTFGNLGEHYELVALKSAGISLQRIMAPLILTAVMISILAFYFSNNVLPFANLKMGSLLYDVREQKPALSFKEGVFNHDIDNYVIKIGEKGQDGVTIGNIMIYDHKENKGNTNLTLAETGKMVMTADKRYLIFTLTNGINYYERTDYARTSSNHPMQRTKFKEETRTFDLSAFTMTRTNEEFFKDNYQMMNVTQLSHAKDSLQKKLDTVKDIYRKTANNQLYYFNAFVRTDSTFKDTATKALKTDLLSNFDNVDKTEIVDRAMNIARAIKDHVFYNNEDFKSRKKLIIRHEIEWHRKYTLSVACLVLFFIGAPLGAIIRKGGLGLPVVVSVLFFVIFHVISFTFEKMVREGVVTAYAGMWIPSLVFLPLGIILTLKATSDSTLFDATAYTEFFKNIFRRKNHQGEYK
jgi:lipopolysaccharide export system permease protein